MEATSDPVKTRRESWDQWVAKRWWCFIVLPQLALGLAFVFVGLGRVGPYYLPSSSSDPYGYGWLMMVAFIPYAIGVLALLRSGESPSPRAIWPMFVLVTIPFVFAPLVQSRDAFQYLFYAKMQLLHGANPYLTPPSAFASDPWHRTIGWSHQVSVYGPLWAHLVAGTVAATGRRIGPSLVTLKALAGVGTGLSLFGLLHLRGDLDDGIEPAGTTAGVAFAFNPFVLSAGALSGHPDVFLAACFVGAIAAAQRKRSSLAVVLLILAALIKAYAAFPLIIYLVVLIRRREVRALVTSTLIGAGLAIVAYAPYWAGIRTLASVVRAGSMTSASLAGSIQEVLESLLGWLGAGDPAGIAASTVRIVGTTIVGATVIVLCRSARTPREPWRAASICLAVVFLVTPWYLPWYAAGLLALALPLRDRAIAMPVGLFSATSFIQVPGAAHLVQSGLRYGAPIWLYRSLRKSG
ncbi:MAG: alpha,6-mannosyltransferase, partial [Actinomycetota bacterium]|nr:alpha,6-mannosyltransferase [Actinomycetota bacterium]